MSFDHLPPISNETIFFESFVKTSFLQKTVRWAKRFCYGFIFFTALSILMQMVFPFCNDVPDLFMQLLFLLIFWGTVELITIPLEYISDHCIVDFEKNWIALSQQRFFYKKITVIAAFNQIKAIGVSARPAGLNNTVFSKTENRYAIFMQTLKNQLVQISDYSLNLDEANSFCHRLYSSHFSGAAYIGGAPGMEIFIDPATEEISMRPATRSMSSLIDAISLPTFQAVLAFLITYSLLSLSLSLIERASRDVFDTDLKIRKQPIFQLIAGLATSDQTTPKPVEPPKGPGKLQTIPLPFPNTAAASAPVNINIASQQIVMPPQKATATATPISTLKTVADTFIEKASPTADVAITPETPETATIETKVETTVAQAEEDSEEGKTQTIPVEPVRVKVQPEERITRVIEEKESTQTPIVIASKQFQRIDTPIPSRIPDVDMDSIFAGATTRKASAEPTPVILPTPVLPVSVSRSPAPERAKSEVTKNSLLPGYGIYPIISVGDSADVVISKLGTPLARFQAMNGWQVVFQGFTVTLNNDTNAKVSRIIITGKASADGALVTPQGISVGSPISEVENKYGPHTYLEGSPGLHYKNLGISFIPSPADATRVGAIQIYQPEIASN